MLITNQPNLSQGMLFNHFATILIQHWVENKGGLRMALPIRVLCCTAACLILTNQSLLAHDPHDPMFNVALSPNFAQDQTIFVATNQLSIKMGVYALIKSTDGGVTWSVVQGRPGTAPITVVAFSPGYATDQTIFTAGNGGLFMSTNQGTSWTTLSAEALTDVTLSPNFATDNTLFIVNTKKQIYKSKNRGQTWAPLTVPASLTAGLNLIAVSPNFDTDHTLLLGTDANGIFESTNGGTSWVQVTAALKLPQVTALAFSPEFSSDRTAFATTIGSGVLISTTAGTSWNLSNSGISDPNATDLALSPTYSTDKTLWVTTAVKGVFQSTNAGASWTGTTVSRALSPLTTTHYQTIAATAGASGNVLYLGMYEGVWTSSASAISWQYIDTLPTRLIRHINVSPNYVNDQTVFANTYGGANLWSITGGATWTFQNTGMQIGYTDASGMSPNYAVDQTAFSSCANGLEKTTNGGALWQLQQILGASVYPRALGVSPNYAKDSTLMVGSTVTGYSGLFLSTNGGTSWVKTSIQGPGVISIAISPGFATDKTAFAAGATTGLYKSTNGGTTWTLLSIPGVPGGVAQVALSPGFATDGTVFVVPIPGGVYKSTNGGSTWAALPAAASMRALDLEISPNYVNDQTFFAGTMGQGLVEFTAGGTTMTPLTAFPDTFVLAVGISPNFVNDHTLFAVGYHGLYKSETAGNAWTYAKEPARIEESRAITGNPPQQPPTITYQGPWTTVTAASTASTNTYITTSQSGSTAVLDFVGSGVHWISSTGPQQGSAVIQLDGVTQTTVSLNSPTNLYQQLVWQVSALPCGAHTLTITSSLTAGQSISVDAFDVFVSTCSFINVPRSQ
jgi:photosystem II stability/assembly factor-like uncharacterized protein